MTAVSCANWYTVATQVFSMAYWQKILRYRMREPYDSVCDDSMEEQMISSRWTVLLLMLICVAAPAIASPSTDSLALMLARRDGPGQYTIDYNIGNITWVLDDIVSWSSGPRKQIADMAIKTQQTM
jgi:hypothetical protein